MNASYHLLLNPRVFLLNLTRVNIANRVFFFNEISITSMSLNDFITPYVCEAQQCEWATCSGQDRPATSSQCMHTVWVIRQQVTQTDCALLSFGGHSYVSDITATYCCSALSSPTEHIVCGEKLEIHSFQKDNFFQIFQSRQNQENGSSIVLQRVWWYSTFFATTPTKRPNKY